MEWPITTRWKMDLMVRYYMQALFYFPRFILYTCFLLLLIYGGLEVAVLGLGFPVDGVFGLLFEAIWGFWQWRIVIFVEGVAPQGRGSNGNKS